jgi:hypothetical protein
MNCRECKKDIEQTVGKRAKEFCNSTCRSNFWQKNKRKIAANNLPANKERILSERTTPNKAENGHKQPLTPNEVVRVKDLTKNTPAASNKPESAPKTNFTINTIKKENNAELSSFERMRRKKMGL